MRGLGALLLLVTQVTSARAASVELAGVYWQPPDAGPLGRQVEAAFRRALERRQAGVVVAPVQAPPPESLKPALAEGVAAWRAFRFADAEQRLGEVARQAGATGGADLDARQLSDLHLYRGLARLELGAADGAWDDFVRAARLDPTRVLDAAQFPPRAVAAYRRAAADAAQSPRATLTLVVPAGAQVRVDGRPAGDTASVALGAHFVRVEAPGFTRFGGVVTVASTEERFAPPLEALAPPEGEALLALEPGARKVLLGALVRSGSGWRFVARRVDRDTRRTASEESPVVAGKSDALVDAALAALLDPPAVVSVPAPAPPKPKRTWWKWVAVAGGLAAAAAIIVPIGVVYGSPTPGGTAGGPIGPLSGTAP